MQCILSMVKNLVSEIKADTGGIYYDLILVEREVEEVRRSGDRITVGHLQLPS